MNKFAVTFFILILHMGCLSFPKSNLQQETNPTVDYIRLLIE